MAPTTNSTGPTKHITMHNFMKHQLRQRLKPAVLWTWSAAAEDDLNGMTPRSYTCAFCRREFRSAQALGGHMNVHRRDRARMRGQYGVAAQLGLLGSASAAATEAPAGAITAAEYTALYVPYTELRCAGGGCT